MATKDPVTTDLDLTDVKVCNAAIQKLLHSRPGYKTWFNKGVQNCERCLAKFSKRSGQPLSFGEKAIQVNNQAYSSLLKYSPNYIECNLKLKSIYVARLTDTYVETPSDKNLIEDINRHLDECEQVYDRILFAITNLIDDQEEAKNDQQAAHLANRTTVDDFDITDVGNEASSRPGKIIYRDQPNFAPKQKLNVHHKSKTVKAWMDDAEGYFDVSHAELLTNKQQQQFIRQVIEDSFWNLIEPDITKETKVWPPSDPEARDGTSCMELLMAKHAIHHPATIDKGQFFDNKQKEKQSDEKYVAEMRNLFEQNGIAEMSSDELLAFHVMKGLTSEKLKEHVVKEVKAKGTTIDMEMIQDAVSVQQSLQAFPSFGSSGNTCNKMHANEKSSNGNQGKNNTNSAKNNNNKGKGKGNSNHQNKGNNNKGKSDQKNQYTYVDFRTLSGNELLKAVTDRECCTFCWKKHDKSAACEGKDHVCKRCDRKGHLDKCCAYPKKKQD